MVTGGAAGIGPAMRSEYAAEASLVCIADIAGAEARIQANKIGLKAFSIAYDGGQLESICGNVAAGRSTSRRHRYPGEQRRSGRDWAFSRDRISAATHRVFNVNVKGLLFTLGGVAPATTARKGHSRKNHQPGLPGWETRGCIGDGV